MTTVFDISVKILIVLAVYSFFAGVITRNYSHVDRLWSILPPLLIILWFFETGPTLVFLCTGIPIVLWGIRLTANFARRGGYAFSLKRGFYEEDYRWEILRKKIPNRFAFEVFNLLFISCFQLGLIFLFTLPAYFAAKSASELTPAMVLISLIQLLLLTLESIADNQQFVFHLRKKTGEPGFNTFGLWRYSRHPNYVCEMGQWICVAAYMLSALGFFHWSAFGALILVALFAGSTVMAESITSSKYPEYTLWKKATPPWIPFIDYPFRSKSRKAFFNLYTR